MLKGHLGSQQVARVIYGAIIGLALVVALQAHPPGAGTVVALIIGTAVAVGLAELYSEMSAPRRGRAAARHEEIAELLDDSVAVTFGTAFPAVFFVLAVATSSTTTRRSRREWTGLGLIAFYGYCAARLSGSSVRGACCRPSRSARGRRADRPQGDPALIRRHP